MDIAATNIRLPRTVLRELRILAARRGQSLAALIREAIEKTYGFASQPKGVDPMKDPFHKLVGSVSDGIADGSVNHDRDIYGLDR